MESRTAIERGGIAVIDKLEPYPAYKDSGVPWLGDVPEHWDIKRNKLFLREVNERSKDGLEELLTVSQYTGVTRRRDNISEEGKLLTNAANLAGYKCVRPGDLVMNIMLAWNGSLGVSPIEGITSPSYCVYRAKADIEPRFLHYLLRTPLFTGVFKTVSTGVIDSRLRLYPEVFFRLPSLLPPKDEQFAIVHYLDYIDRQTKYYVHNKQKLIGLLEEQKYAIINRAVTRGLEPNVKFKPSGVEWLRDVPEHWEIKRIKYLASLKSGESITSLEINENGDYPVFGGNGLRGFTSKYTHNGDFVLIGRQGALCGNINYAQGHFWASEHAVVAHPIQTYNLLWFGELLRTMNLNQYSISAAQPGLSVERIQNIGIPVPPLKEQKIISDYISRSTNSLNKSISISKKEISLLSEYRTRLISDVVTGKLDVRGVAANLPVETDEPEMLEYKRYEGEEYSNDEFEELSEEDET